nr:Ni/Fe hydrogenase subunit alpha [Candidatus Sigynarchaeum springense]
MAKELSISPITRLIGDGGVKILLNDKGAVKDVKLGIYSTRFFEKFAEGRQAEFLPRIAPRICGACSIPHHIASTKSIEDAWSITIPPTAKKLRQLLLHASFYTSHLQHFFTRAAPDFIFGIGATPEERNIMNLIKEKPDVGSMALKMMDFGQNICAEMGGKAVHPVTAIPGGMTKVLSEEARDRFLKQIDEQMDFSRKAVEYGTKIMNDRMDVFKSVVPLPTFSTGLTNNGIHDVYEGNLRVISPDGKSEDFDPRNCIDAIAEHVAPHSYATHAYIKKAGYPAGLVTTNCLARLNCVEKMATPLAQTAFEQFRGTFGKPCFSPLASNWARLVEMSQSLEIIAALLKDPEIVSKDIKEPNIVAKDGMGVGIVEGSRGMHIYNIWTDEKGLIKKLNIIAATNLNVGSMEMILKKNAVSLLEKKAGTEQLNTLEMIARAFDLCMPCAAH